MGLILGIDAAWTAKGSSGVALLEYAKDSKRILACAPSYASFVARSKGIPVEWNRPDGGPPNVADLLRAAAIIGNAPIDVVAIDMPIARTRISGRRSADQEISKEFGRAWASTHSPTPHRPGDFGHQLTKNFVDVGFSLATTDNHLTRPALVEVYPLAALVRLLNLDVRPPYKVSRSARYWPQLRSREERIKRLLDEWSNIEKALRRNISMDWFIPPRSEVPSLSALKPYEDALDAIISAYVGALFLANEAEPFGDGDATIWVPKPGQRKSSHRPDEYLSAISNTLSEWNSPADRRNSRNL